MALYTAQPRFLPKVRRHYLYVKLGAKMDTILHSKYWHSMGNSRDLWPCVQSSRYSFPNIMTEFCLTLNLNVPRRDQQETYVLTALNIHLSWMPSLEMSQAMRPPEPRPSLSEGVKKPKVSLHSCRTTIYWQLNLECVPAHRPTAEVARHNSPRSPTLNESILPLYRN